LWTHNDPHASNFLWSDASDKARAVAVIDFGLADRSNAIYDLAHAIERNIVEWLELRPGLEDADSVPVHLDHLKAMLDGYESVQPLNDAEAAALAPMIALCHAEFALSEADYFCGVLHSEEKVRVASIDYLVGHARWFRGAGGDKLLDAIQRWAEKSERREAAPVGAKD
jgi:Ser/Thr protein kinase RdoA (MazF antagonist)